MNPNPVFHTQTDAYNLGYARARAFGVLAMNGSEGPLLSHIPFMVDEDDRAVWLHLVRSNPIVQQLEAPCAAKIAVSGPDSYVSPDWYGVKDQVPTWNYVAVHLSGTLELRPQGELHALLDRQSAYFEDRLAPKVPWTSGKMSDGLMSRMMRATAPCKMTLTGISGTWKFNQNKPSDVRLRAAEHVARDGQGTDLQVLAKLMRSADGQA